jgi:hypothetical protein
LASVRAELEIGVPSLLIPKGMDQIHIENLGKSAKVTLKRLPPAEPDPPIVEKTSLGAVAPLKVINGVNSRLDEGKLTSDALIKGDPELALDRAGEMLDPESLSAAYIDSADAQRVPVANFTLTDIVYDATGQQKERRPHLTRKANIADIYPVKIGKRMPLQQALTQFVFKQSLQILHEDGVTMDFLFAIAKDLHEKQEVALLGAGPKGNQPLVIRDKGSPYRAFLYGEIGGDKNDQYKLLLLLSDQELKRPEAAES